jgi:hypothetical protein
MLDSARKPDRNQGHACPGSHEKRGLFISCEKWGRNQVKQKMMFAMARVGLKVGVREAKIFSDVRDSLREDTGDANIARICEICCGDHEGEEAKRWSSSLEDKHMRETRLEHRCEPKNLRDKGGIEMRITKAKADIVESLYRRDLAPYLVAFSLPWYCSKEITNQSVG